MFFSSSLLTLYDGKSNKANTIGAYCGHNIPKSMISTSNEILIHYYHYQEYMDGLGFILKYHQFGKQTSKKDLLMVIWRKKTFNDYCTYAIHSSPWNIVAFQT